MPKSGSSPNATRSRRIFLGFQEIAGYYGQLRQGFTELGVPSVFVNLSDHPFQYDGAGARGLTRSIKNARTSRSKLRPLSLAALCLLVWESWLRVCLLTWAVTKFDSFILGFGSTFLQRSSLDLMVLKLLRKRVVCVFHGSDARPAYLDGSVAEHAGSQMGRECGLRARATERRVSMLDRYADAIVENALSGHFHKRQCVHWIVVGIPFVAPDVVTQVNTATRHGIRILHSPSHPASKGTDRIRHAVNNVRNRGHQLDLVEISGRPYSEVLVELARCDFVVDQLYSDTPMATFAAEAAHFGKPAIVCGYGADAFRCMLPSDATPPTLYCLPDELESAVERLAVDSDYRSQLGEQARRFVQVRWNRKEVAARLLRVLAGDYPESWLFDPRDIRYCHGYGLSPENARDRIAKVIAWGGVDAMRLHDKPDLEKRLCEFARLKPDQQEQPSCSKDS